MLKSDIIGKNLPIILVIYKIASGKNEIHKIQNIGFSLMNINTKIQYFAGFDNCDANPGYRVSGDHRRS